MPCLFYGQINHLKSQGLSTAEAIKILGPPRPENPAQRRYRLLNIEPAY